MPSASNALLQYEAGQSLVAMAAMTDSGDQQTFTLTGSTVWSSKSGYDPKIYPNGLVTGGAVAPAVSGTNDKVDVAALTCYLAGVLTSVAAAADTSITRPATAKAKIDSITVTSAGAIAVVAGTDGNDTTFVETRGAAGGPPFIPVGSIEIAQVRVTSNTAAKVITDQIFSVVGVHQERYDYPLFDAFPLGDATHTTGYISFGAALSKIHTGSVVKGVYAQVYTPILAEVPLAGEFVPPEETYSVSSVQYYGGTLGSSSKSLGQGKFNVYPKDGVTDAIIGQAGELLTWKFFPDRNKLPYIIMQGTLGIARTFPAASNIQAACTLSASQKGIERSS